MALLTELDPGKLGELENEAAAPPEFFQLLKRAFGFGHDHNSQGNRKARD